MNTSSSFPSSQALTLTGAEKVFLTARRLKHSALISDLLGPKQRIDFANLSLTEVNILTELERAYLEYRSRFTHALWNLLRKASLSPKIKEGSRKPYKEYR